VAPLHSGKEAPHDPAALVAAKAPAVLGLALARWARAVVSTLRLALIELIVVIRAIANRVLGLGFNLENSKQGGLEMIGRRVLCRGHEYDCLRARAARWGRPVALVHSALARGRCWRKTITGSS
jgi:hypothetical protein